jgi:hypothetical protein
MKKLYLAIASVLCLSCLPGAAHASDCVPSSTHECFIVWQVTCSFPSCALVRRDNIGQWTNQSPTNPPPIASSQDQIESILHGSQCSGTTCVYLNSTPYTSGAACQTAAVANGKGGYYFCDPHEYCSGGVCG